MHACSLISVGLVHEVGSFLGGWEALVDEGEVSIEEHLVVLEVVLLARQELVHLHQVRAVHGLSLLIEQRSGLDK